MINTISVGSEKAYVSNDVQYGKVVENEIIICDESFLIHGKIYLTNLTVDGENANKSEINIFSTFIGLKGYSGKLFTLGTTTAYFIRTADDQFSSPETLEIAMKPLAMGTVFTVKNQLFSADGMSMKMANGGLVRGDRDQKNLWLLSEDGNSAKPILSTKGYDELNLKVKTDEAKSGESKYSLNWSSDPLPMVDGMKIAFVSNRNGILSVKRGQSIYIVNRDGSNEKLLIDSQKYGNLTIVGTAKDLIAAETDKYLLKNK